MILCLISVGVAHLYPRLYPRVHGPLHPSCIDISLCLFHLGIGSETKEKQVQTLISQHLVLTFPRLLILLKAPPSSSRISILPKSFHRLPILLKAPLSSPRLSTLLGALHAPQVSPSFPRLSILHNIIYPLQGFSPLPQASPSL